MSEPAIKPGALELEIAALRVEAQPGAEYARGWNAGIDRAIQVAREHAAKHAAAIGEATTDALAELTAAGLKTGGHPRYGYRVGADGRTLRDNPAEQRVLVEARKLRARGMSLGGIAKQLSERGMLSRNGTPFDATRIRRMLDRK